MYRRRIIKSRVMTKQDFIYQAARFFLYEDYLDIPVQLEILVNSLKAYDVSKVEYAGLYARMHKTDLLSEISHLASLLERAYKEGQKSKKYDRSTISRSTSTEVEED